MITMTDDELNEAIFKAKGWVKLSFPAFPKWQRPIRAGEVDEFGKGMTVWYELVPDYTHDWRLCGELLEEMAADNLTTELLHLGHDWTCIARRGRSTLIADAISDSPTHAIAECGLKWLARKKEQE